MCVCWSHTHTAFHRCSSLLRPFSILHNLQHITLLIDLEFLNSSIVSPCPDWTHVRWKPYSLISFTRMDHPFLLTFYYNFLLSFQNFFNLTHYYLWGTRFSIVVVGFSYLTISVIPILASTIEPSAKYNINSVISYSEIDFTVWKPEMFTLIWNVWNFHGYYSDNFMYSTLVPRSLWIFVLRKAYGFQFLTVIVYIGVIFVKCYVNDI